MCMCMYIYVYIYTHTTILYDILKTENALAKPVHNMAEYIICGLVRLAIIWLITRERFSALVQCEIFKCYMRKTKL